MDWGRKTYGKTETLDTGSCDEQNHNQVTENPGQNQVGSESLVRVIHALLILLFRLDIRRQRTLHGRLELTVNIGLGLINFLNEIRLVILFLGLRFWQCFTLVGTLGTPGNIVPVTESVNHQNVDRAGHSGEVGPRRSEHVVGVHVEETGNEVDTVCRNQGDQNDTGTGGAEERLQEMSDALTHIEIQSTTHEGVGDQVEGVNHSVSLNNREIDEGQSVKQT